MNDSIKKKNLWSLVRNQLLVIKCIERDKCFNDEMSRFLKNKLEYSEKEMEKRIEGEHS
jgi:hypothetical protein